MANVEIIRIGPAEYGLIGDLYNAIFRPPQDASFFERRLANRTSLVLVAELQQRPVGFLCSYELRPTTFYNWLTGVVSDARRMGVASQLLQAEHAWARERGYEMCRLECYNHCRPMLTMAIRHGYDVVGIRWDAHTSGNLVIFEKNIESHEPSAD
jgi:GNAT superfamily N-acetyltransferase